MFRILCNNYWIMGVIIVRKSSVETARHERIMLFVTSILACVGAIFLCVTVFSAITAKFDLSDGVITLMSSISLCAGCFAASYTASKRKHRNGLVTGIICGGIIFFAVLLGGIIFVKGITAGGMFSKLVMIITCSSIGGIVGVNSRAKFH
jgi:putative membrane protein (TIGR04086 family)